MVLEKYEDFVNLQSMDFASIGTENMKLADQFWPRKKNLDMNGHEGIILAYSKKKVV